MRSSQVLHVTHCHAGGEVGDVITSGYPPPPGDTLWEQSRWIAKDKQLRNFVLNEPRGGVFRHVNLLVPPKNPEADAAFIIMEPEDTPPMSGSNAMCIATVLLETGILPYKEGERKLCLEAPGGLVTVSATCTNGKVERVAIINHPSFSAKLDATLETTDFGTIKVDTAYGGDSFVVVDAHKLGFSLDPSETRELAEFGIKLSDAASEQIGFAHPALPDWKHISFCLFGTPIVDGNTRHAVAIRPGKIDRSPTGTGVCARLAVQYARGLMRKGEALTAHSIIGSTFTGRVLEETMLHDVPAIIPEIVGKAWIYGTSQWTLDPDDPWPEGYRLSDTWAGSPAIK